MSPNFEYTGLAVPVVPTRMGEEREDASAAAAAVVGAADGGKFADMRTFLRCRVDNFFPKENISTL
jgi:hypothetical protein